VKVVRTVHKKLKRIPGLLRGEKQRNVEKGGPDTPLEEMHTMSSGFSDEEDQVQSVPSPPPPISAQQAADILCSFRQHTGSEGSVPPVPPPPHKYKCLLQYQRE